MNQYAHRRRLPWSCFGLLMAAALPATSQAGTIGLSFDPPTQSVAVDDTFMVEITASMIDPIVAFGFTFDFNDALFQLEDTTIGSEFLTEIPGDDDFLGAIAFPDPVSGTDVVLGTATFKALASGTGAIDISFDENSLTEGFAEVTPGNFATPNQTNVATVTVTGGGSVPEPATLAMVLMGGLALIRQNRRGYRLTKC